MSFNQAQKQAVTHDDGPCLVLAGPGSGKTLTIVNRIQYLIEKCKVRPEEILVITFTKYAAMEMKLRLQALMGGRRIPVTMGTFHGIYYGILKWAYKLGPENIFSEEEKTRLIRQIIDQQEELEIFDEEDFLQEIINEIGTVKNHRISIEEYESKRCATEVFRTVYTEYEKIRKQLHKIDFDDMLVLCYELFVKRPDVLRLWQKKFRYILIDEFQDINRVQYDVIRMLAEPEQNLFAVGDDDQAIYGFRGADAKLMFQFRKDYPTAKQIVLDVNYRSTSNIVRNALKVIGHNRVRFEKEIHAKKEVGQSLHVQEVKDSAEEAEYVVSEIEETLKSGVKAEQIAVLYRIHTDARAVVSSLVERRIPFQMREHMPNLYDHFIAKDICAYLRMSQGEMMRGDFLRVMNRPVRYLGRDAVSGSGKISFEEMRKVYAEKEWMQDRIDQFEWDLKMLNKMAPYAAIQYLRRKIGYDDFLREYAQSKGVQKADLFEKLSELEEAAKPYRTAQDWFEQIGAYTEALKMKAQKREQNRSGIRLMTMHAAKGLEFDTVFIVQANDGQIPYKKALKEAGEEEERRLFYVAMTRAKERLQITYVKIKNGKDVFPSRFVDEIFE